MRIIDEKILTGLFGSVIMAVILAALIGLVSVFVAGPFTGNCYAESVWYSDTSLIPAPTGASAVYGKGTFLDGTSSWLMVVKTNDTAAAGFTNDSINLEYGYRTFFITLNGNSKIDTFYNAAVIADTIVPTTWDSTQITGYGVDIRAITPTACQFIQPYIKKLAGQRGLVSSGNVCIEMKRIVATRTQSR